MASRKTTVITVTLKSGESAEAEVACPTGMWETPEAIAAGHRDAMRDALSAAYDRLGYCAELWAVEAGLSDGGQAGKAKAVSRETGKTAGKSRWQMHTVRVSDDPGVLGVWLTLESGEEAMRPVCPSLWEAVDRAMYRWKPKKPKTWKQVEAARDAQEEGILDALSAAYADLGYDPALWDVEMGVSEMKIEPECAGGWARATCRGSDLEPADGMWIVEWDWLRRIFGEIE